MCFCTNTKKNIIKSKLLFFIYIYIHIIALKRKYRERSIMVLRNCNKSFLKTCLVLQSINDQMRHKNVDIIK